MNLKFVTCYMLHATCYMDLLGVRIDNFSKKEILEKIESFLDEPKFHQIATVNPEFILAARKDKEFKNILNNCDLNVADGIGIKYAFLRHFQFLKTRIAGVDLLDEILKIANEKKLAIFLAISKNGLSSFEEIKAALQKIYPNLIIDGEEMYPNNTGHWSLVTGHHTMLCNFGAPAQEKFLNSAKSDTIRLAMGVGGSFDFLTGKIKRAPKWMQFFGFEWLFRLCQEPKYRAMRIFNAIFVFPIMVIFNK